MSRRKKELDHIADVFEKFLYGKLIKREGFRADGLRIVWLDENQQKEAVSNL